MGGPSGPMLSAQGIAIWHKSIGAEAPATKAAALPQKPSPPKNTGPEGLPRSGTDFGPESFVALRRAAAQAAIERSSSSSPSP
ncbi:DUF6053 domain-containing protein [Lysobacter enzymogenes]|uniref:DUF6053 domain-containing protein n=1 Tax=Lysobacter enzymogenes TaxID=69 RepID=UPI003CCD713E